MDMGISVNGDATAPALVCMGLLTLLLTAVLTAHSLRLWRTYRPHDRQRQRQRRMKRARILVGRDTWGTAAQQELALDGGVTVAAFLPGLPPIPGDMALPAPPTQPLRLPATPSATPDGHAPSSGALRGASGARGAGTRRTPAGGPQRPLSAEEEEAAEGAEAQHSFALPPALAGDARVNAYRLEAMRLVWRDAHAD